MSVTHRRGRRSRALLVLAAAATVTAAARAEQLPLWEAGGGLSVIRLQDYRGSEQSRDYVLPVPWFVYRGEVIKADREGLRAKLFDTDRIELDISVNGSVPVASDRNRARSGMRDLKPTLELGPVLNVTLWRQRDASGTLAKLDLRLPVRAGISYREGRPVDVGFIAQPNLNLDLKLPTQATVAERWNVGLVLGALAGTRRNNAYFYEVEPQYATPERPAYRARGGYAGWQAIVALSRRSGRWWTGGFIKYENLGSAVFADSPLVTARSHVTGGLAVSYVFAESERRVEAER